ncbi:MAG: MFS transporter, partial [Flavobacteriales bacterium]
MYRKPLLLTVSLFFLWGLSYGLLDVLNKHFQQVLHLSRKESSFLQLSYFGAYFIMAIPAGRLMARAGYSNGVLVGLLLFALGALSFFPAAEIGGFVPFLVALFIL